jgi:hypothetical protein
VTPSRSSTAVRAAARGPSSSATSTITSPTTSTSPATRSPRRIAAGASDEHSSRSAAWSVSTRLSSSGIVRSYERIPASTWATGIPACAPASAPASVEFVSPYTSTVSGASAASSGSSAASMRAVWLVLEPPPSSRRCSGRGRPSSSKKTWESSAS